MTTLGIAAVVIAAAWLLVLTIVVLLCVRQLGIFTVRIELLSRGGAVSGTGPTAGFSVPDELRARHPVLGRARSMVVLVSGSCTTCFRVIEEWRGGDGPELVGPDDILVLITGNERAESDRTEQRLTGLAQVMREPDSSSLARALSLTHRPSAMLLEDGIVAGSSVLERASDLDRILAGPEIAAIESHTAG